MKKYSPLVEQVYYQLFQQGNPTSKEFIFNYLKSRNLLDDDGQPTKYAIESGAVEKVTSPIDKYKAQHPVLVNFKHDDFNVNDKLEVSVKPKAVNKYLRKLKELNTSLDKVENEDDLKRVKKTYLN